MIGRLETRRLVGRAIQDDAVVARLDLGAARRAPEQRLRLAARQFVHLCGSHAHKHAWRSRGDPPVLQVYFSVHAIEVSLLPVEQPSRTCSSVTRDDADGDARVIKK